MADTKKYLDLVGLDHLVKKINNLKANVESPNFIGTPTAPTPSAGDDSTKVATTAFVKNAVTSGFEWQDLGGEGE